MNKLRTATVYARQQMSAKLLTLAVWTLIWSLLLLLFAVVFKSLNNDAAKSSEVFKQLPSGVFSSFNIDPATYLSHIESFISGQFLSVYLLAGSIFAFSLGVGSIGKKIENRMLATTLTKPISRTWLYCIEFVINSWFLITASAALFGISIVIFNTVLKDHTVISVSYFSSLFSGSGILFIAYMALGQLVGTILNGGRAVLVGAAIVVFSWFLNSLAPLVHISNVIQIISLFHYFDVTLLRSSFELNFSLTVQLVAIILGLVLLGRYIFSNKNIYI